MRISHFESIMEDKLFFSWRPKGDETAVDSMKGTLYLDVISRRVKSIINIYELSYKRFASD